MAASSTKAAVAMVPTSVSPETIELRNRLTAPSSDVLGGGVSSSDEEEGGGDEFEQCDCPDGEKRPDKIPYISVYEESKDFRKRGYFIPALPITAKIDNAERDTQGIAHPVNRFIYTINLKHGPFAWTIHRRYGDFFQLNNRLKLFHAGAKMKSPFKRHRRPGKHRDEEGGGGGDWHASTHRLHYIGGGDLIEDWTKQDEIKLIPTQRPNTREIQLGFHPTDTPIPNTTTFENGSTDGLEYIDAQEETDGTMMMEEGQKPKGTKHRLPDFPTLPDSFVDDEHLEERKMRLQEYLSAILHIHAYRNHHETAEFLGVSRLSFVHNLGHKHGEGYIKQRPGGEYAMHRIRNFCLTHCCKWKKRWFVVKDSFVASLHDDNETVYDVVLYDAFFMASTNPTPQPGIDQKGLTVRNLQRDLVIKCKSPEEAEGWKHEINEVSRAWGQVWFDEHRFGSSYPERESSYAQWFVDGRPFMEHVANMMEIAKEEIFITDWWLTPHIYLKRPMKDEHWRLDNVLKRKAEAGVRIFVLIYREVIMALPGMNSYWTEQYLTALHPNIRVMRHPDHLYSRVLYWAHHEKTIVIDQQIAFAGGIDLCYGRWDDHKHRLTDLGYGEDFVYEDQTEFIERLRTRYQSQDSQTESYHTPPQSPPTLSMFDDEHARRVHFDPNEETAKIVGKTEADSAGGGKKPQLNVADILRTRYRKLEDIEKNRRWAAARSGFKDRIQVIGDEKLWPGKDYVNFINKDIPEPEKPFEDFVDRTAIPRLPWHDIACVVYGSTARDVARHFIQRWNATKLDAFHIDIKYPLLIPKTYENVRVPDIFRRMSHACHSQVLRSAGMWSTGMSATESSIHQAYQTLIDEAEHYIYIENQFFVSQLDGIDVENRIASAIFDRIVRAHRNRETFRVYIVMPLLPAFEKQSGSLQVVLHWTYVSISKGPRALLNRLRKEIGDPSPYISFCALRTHARLVDKLVTELVYIHSKLMIVDDRYSVIGSANINDRSQLGERDSEICLFVEDTEFSKVEISGRWSGAFAGTLRKHLFAEHLGLMDLDSPTQEIDISDPVSDDFWNRWNTIAKKNTAIYEKVFECAPSDRLRTLEEFAMNEQTPKLADRDPESSAKLLTKVQGHLVQFPLTFLIDSDLTPSITSAEGIMPSYVFT